MIGQAQTKEGVGEKKVGRIGKEKGNCEEEAEGWEEVGRNQDQPISSAGIMDVPAFLLSGFYAVDLVEGQKGKKRVSQFMF